MMVPNKGTKANAGGAPGSSRGKPPASADWYSLALMAVAAPFVAACLQSWWVYHHHGFANHDAMIGGSRYVTMGKMTRSFGLIDVIPVLVGVLVAAIPSFIFLLPGRAQCLDRWILWVLCVAIWMWLMFCQETIAAWLVGLTLAIINPIVIGLMDTSKRARSAHFAIWAVLVIFGLTVWMWDLWDPWLIPFIGVPILALSHFVILRWARRRIGLKNRTANAV